MFDGRFSAHFLAAAEIWRAFAAGQISTLKRDQALAPLRAALAAIPRYVEE